MHAQDNKHILLYFTYVCKYFLFLNNQMQNDTVTSQTKNLS